MTPLGWLGEMFHGASHVVAQVPLAVASGGDTPEPPSSGGTIQDHWCLTLGAGLLASRLLNPGVEVAIVQELDAERFSFGPRLLAEVGEGDEDPCVSLDTFPHQRATQLPDLVDAHELSSPALALDELARPVGRELEVNVAVRTVLTSGLSNLPSFPPEEFANEPLELLRGEETKVGR